MFQAIMIHDSMCVYCIHITLYKIFFSRLKMPYTDQKDFHSMPDCTFDVAAFPGKYNKNNKTGTLMTKSEWIEQEARKWFNEMQKIEKYYESPFSFRAMALKHWLQRNLMKMSTIATNELLLLMESEHCEEENDSDGNDSEGLNLESSDNNEEIQMEVDGGDVNDSPDMFEGTDDDMEVPEAVKKTQTEIFREKEETVQKFLKLSDQELMENEDLPAFVLKDGRFLDRKTSYVKNFIETFSSQDILVQMTQLPKYVTEHDLFKDKIKHLSKAEKSTKRIVKNLKETLSGLRNDSSRKAFEQRVTLVASVTDHRYGIPDVGETVNVKIAARKLKLDFMRGNKTNLEPNKNKNPERYPPEVFEIAHESWINRSTKPDPAKHARPKTALKDGEETVPTIWQVVTDNEAYEQFKENDAERVREVMQKSCEKLREKYRNNPASENKQKIIKTLDRREATFPGKTWFLARKPAQTKMLDDHSTALCKDCVTAQLNFETLYKARKKFCRCKTSNCLNWVCLCDEEDPNHCECNHPCECDDCSSCQVNET